MPLGFNETQIFLPIVKICMTDNFYAYAYVLLGISAMVYASIMYEAREKCRVMFTNKET